MKKQARSWWCIYVWKTDELNLRVEKWWMSERPDDGIRGKRENWRCQVSERPTYDDDDSPEAEASQPASRAMNDEHWLESDDGICRRWKSERWWIIESQVEDGNDYDGISSKHVWTKSWWMSECEFKQWWRWLSGTTAETIDGVRLWSQEAASVEVMK